MRNDLAKELGPFHPKTQMADSIMNQSKEIARKKLGKDLSGHLKNQIQGNIIDALCDGIDSI
jgi:hypothetical protein